MRPLSTLALLTLTALASPLAAADEGMWLLNQFPSARVKALAGFEPDAKWLHKLQLGSVRLAGGCSGSFVSSDGLVLTNHHCAHRCIEQLSTATEDKVKSGFLAKTEKEEVRCPEIEVNDLTDITDVTSLVQQATAGLDGKAQNDARKAVIARLEKTCTQSEAHPDKVRCDVVTLFHGGKYDLYKYRRYQDVRLAFAPEFAAAFFGGDPDNFNFPRYDLDMSLLRVYEGGKPLHPPAHFRLSSQGTQEGDLVFVSGHPGGTDRQLTVAELLYQRDVALPDRLLQLAELRGLITEYQNRGPEQKRHSTDLLFGIENSFKALKGRYAALTDPAMLTQKTKDELELRAKIAADPALEAKVGGAFDEISKATDRLKEIRRDYNYEEQTRGFQSSLFRFARTLVRGAAEREKPNDTRFPEFKDSVLPQVTQSLFSTAPLFPELEVATLTFSLTKLREDLGADHPFVKEVLGKMSPEYLAKALIRGDDVLKTEPCKLGDVKVRKQLWEGGSAAIAASTDPMILLAKLIDADGRKIRKVYEDEVEATVKKNEELLAQARAKVYGTSTYPDATFTLRLSYGTTKGWLENGVPVAPYTTFAGAFERNTAADPFNLPDSWLKAREKLHLDTKLNFASTNDIIGGNSGSPVVDKNAEVVGLIFDGNIHSLGGDYGFDPATNRAVAVDSRAILEALHTIYGADRLAKEMSR